MQNPIKLILLIALLVISGAQTYASEITSIHSTQKAPLFDGRCNTDEWQSATKFNLPAKTAIYLMHDKGSLYVCAKGKAEDYTVIDIYVEHTETGILHNLHASAQLSERTFEDEKWGESQRWNLNDWSGFWVPYAGNDETEEGIRPKFLKGSDREIQVLRKKFAGSTWNVMIAVGGIYHPKTTRSRRGKRREGKGEGEKRSGGG